MMKSNFLCSLLCACLLTSTAAYALPFKNKAELERGHYLVKIGGCNDCHTPGYPQSGGKIPESDWLTGNPVAFEGPWGATYPSNLRLKIQSMTESEWLVQARKKARPPMPWFTLAAMSGKDLKAIYQYIHSLGAKGQPMPDYVSPGQAINTPYIEFFPKNLPQAAK
ncbi:MAG TPA: cytochrome C [Gallionella sp.]|nr:cytochrome C [Gallionella sp.]